MSVLTRLLDLLSIRSSSFPLQSFLSRSKCARYERFETHSAETNMWKLQKKIRLAEEKIQELDECCDGLAKGIVPDALLLTPRARHEERKVWSNQHRTSLRRQARERLITSCDAQKETLLKSIEQFRKELLKKRKLPPLHLDFIRDEDDSPKKFILGAHQIKKKLIHGSENDGNTSEVDIAHDLKHLRMCCQSSWPLGWFPLHLAVQKNNMSALIALLKLSKFDKSFEDSHSFVRTKSTSAKEQQPVNQRISNVKLPVPDLNAQDNSGYTALHTAFMLERFDMARALVAAGADPTCKNRENQNAFQVGLALGFREEVEQIADEIGLENLALLHAKRFFKEMFSGNPEYHHYRTKEYYNNLLIAYVLTYHPTIFKPCFRSGMYGLSFGFRPKLPNVDLFLTENIYEPDAEDLEEDFNYNCSKPAAQENGDVLEMYDSRRDVKNVLTKDKEKFTFEGYKIFRFIKLSKLKKYVQKSKRWRVDSEKSCKRIAINIYNKSLTPEEIAVKFRQGVKFYENWKVKNKKILQADEQARIRAASEALRLKRLKEDQERKLKAARQKETARLKDLEKRGLANLDPNAGVKISFEQKEVETIVYSADNTDPALYEIVLLTKPKGNVLIKLRVIKPRDHQGEPQFVTTPKVVSFTPANWNVAQLVRIDARDDDAVVRLKREVAQKPPGGCDHIIENTIQSTTDMNYKYAGLKWYPTNNVTIHVVD